MKVEYDVYSNTIIVNARDCVVEMLSEHIFIEYLTSKYPLNTSINYKICLNAVNAQIAEIDLSNALIAEMDLSGAIIKGPANFFNTTFLKELNCVGTCFLGEVTFLCTTFESCAMFDHAIFEGDIDFAYAEGCEMNFAYASFNRQAYWEEISLTEKLIFEEAIFKDSFYLVYAIVEEAVNLKNVTIKFDCDIESVRTQSIDISGMNIGGKLTLRHIKHKEGRFMLTRSREHFLEVHDNGLKRIDGV